MAERALGPAEEQLEAPELLRGQGVVLAADAFNLFNSQNPTDYDNFTETTFGALNPNFGVPVLGGNTRTPSFHTPLQVRVGARFEW